MLDEKAVNQVEFEKLKKDMIAAIESMTQEQSFIIAYDTNPTWCENCNENHYEVMLMGKSSNDWKAAVGTKMLTTGLFGNRKNIWGNDKEN